MIKIISYLSTAVVLVEFSSLIKCLLINLLSRFIRTKTPTEPNEFQSTRCTRLAPQCYPNNNQQDFRHNITVIHR